MNCQTPKLRLSAAALLSAFAVAPVFAWGHPGGALQHPYAMASLAVALAACVALLACAYRTSRRLRAQLRRDQDTAQALAESQRQLQLILSQMPAITWTTDRDMRLTSSSASGLKAIQASLGRMAGVRISHIFRTRDPEFPALKAHFRALEGQSVEFELDYGGRSYAASVEPLRDEVGRITGCIGVAFDVTGRRTAEKVSRVNERFLNSMFDGIQDGLCVLDRDLRVVRANEAFETWCGAKDGGEVAGTACYASLFERAAICEGCPAALAFEEGRIQNQRVARAFPDGRTQWFDVTAYPLLDGHGDTEYVVEFIKDVSQQQEAEDLLRTSRRQYRDLVRGLPLGVLRTTPFPDSTISMANPALARMLGFCDAKELLGLRINGFYSDERDQRRLYADLGAHGEVRGREIEWIRRDGSRIWVSLCSRAQLDEAGQPEYIDSTAEDVTHRKLMEQSLLDSEETFRALTEAANDAIVMVDGAGAVTFWNSAAEQIFGYASDEALGQVFFDMLAHEDGGDAKEAALSFHEGGGRCGKVCDVVARRKDGQPAPVEVSTAGVCVRGHWRGIAVVRDVAERKETEARQARYAAEMETANRQLEEAIERANRMAVEAELANSAKTQFLANMSHEIRTPLNGILGMAELLAFDGQMAPAQRERIEIIGASGETLLEIINDILDFSKIEAGRLELEAIPFDIHEVLEGVAELMGPRACAKGVEVIVRFETDAPRFVQGDPARLRQVAMNLVGNAVKFTREGYVCLSLSGGSGGAPLRIEVRDTGIGISEERLSQLFQPFTQSDASTTREYGGTGLGLAICKQLVERMGGRIGADSVPGEGSLFWFDLPLELADAPGGARLWPPGALAGARVLLADDRAQTREALLMMLEATGCEVTVCGSGEELAAAALAPGGLRYDIAVAELDLVPGESAAALASGPWRAESGLLCLTGCPTQREELEAAGASDAFLVKPIKRESLLRLVARAAGLRAGNPRETELPAAGLIEAPAHRMSVLLVEDNPVNQKVAASMLERLGLEHDVATNGHAAVEAVAAKRYGVVLMDCQMPGMDGFEATAAIREHEGAARHTPIIAMTAMAMKGDEAKCLAAGMDAYLAKPIKLQALREALTYYMRADGAASPEGPAESDRGVYRS